MRSIKFVWLGVLMSIFLISCSTEDSDQVQILESEMPIVNDVMIVEEEEELAPLIQDESSSTDIEEQMLILEDIFGDETELMLELADAVIEGTAIDVSYGKEDYGEGHGEILSTYTTVRVDSWIKEFDDTPATLIIRTLGGINKKDGIRLTVSDMPQAPAQGETFVVALEAIDDGRFRILMNYGYTGQ